MNGVGRVTASEEQTAEPSLLRAIFETTPECIQIVASDGTLLQINSAGRAIIEADDDEVEGACIYDVIAPEFREMWKAQHRRVCLGEKLRWEFDIIGFGGTRRHVETHAVPLRMPDGTHAQLAITRDVGNRQTRRQAALESEHQFKQLLETLPTAIYTTDLDGRITYFNEAAVEFAGRRPELGELWCVTWRLYQLDGTPLPHDECPMAVTLKEGRPVRGVEAIAERPDGTRIRFLPYPTLLNDTSGRPVGAINLLVDMTDKSKAEAMSARLASIVETSDDAIFSVSLKNGITSWNSGAARIFGYEASEIIGQPLARLIPPDLLDQEKNTIARIRAGERVDHYETVRLAKGGERRCVSLTVSPLYDQFGNMEGVSKVARDITARKQAEELQRLLIEELNHRVKNTLAIIQSIATMSLSHAKDPRDFVPSFNGRLKSLARAHDLLTQTKLQGTAFMDLIREQVLLGGVDDKRVICSGPNIVLDSQMTVQLGLVLHELATNARKYGALSIPGGHLSINWEVRTNGQRCLFLLWKERSGPKVDAPKERGFGSTLIERTSRGYGGSASVCYGADGVTCDIALPLPEHIRASIMTSASEKGALALFQSPTKGNGLKGKRVIIIEDEPLVSMLLESTLEEAGCEIVGVASVIPKAISLIEQGSFDVALLDANLAGRGVDELAAKLTQKDISFAFVTGHDRGSLPQGFRDAALLRKPFSNNELIAMVEMLAYQPSDVVRLRRKDN